MVKITKDNGNSKSISTKIHEMTSFCSDDLLPPHHPLLLHPNLSAHTQEKPSNQLPGCKQWPNGTEICFSRVRSNGCTSHIGLPFA